MCIVVRLLFCFTFFFVIFFVSGYVLEADHTQLFSVHVKFLSYRKQESLANAKVSARQQCVYEGHSEKNVRLG